jgi:hypothetical protein
VAKIKRHTLVVEIECHDAQGSHQAEDRLLDWLETYGHTSVSHGFDFLTVRRVAKKTNAHLDEFNN